MKLNSEDKGLIIVFTGDGKGKTSAALGTGLRMAGHNGTVFMVQFMKGRTDTGELKFLKDSKNWDIIQAGASHFIKKGKPTQRDIELARIGFNYVEDALKGTQYDLIILDEIHVAIDYQLIPVERVVKAIEERQKHLHVILTGRNASENIINLADIVSDIQAVKHIYTKGLNAVEGIDF